MVDNPIEESNTLFFQSLDFFFGFNCYAARSGRSLTAFVSMLVCYLFEPSLPLLLSADRSSDQLLYV